jgi:hypothetical protein
MAASGAVVHLKYCRKSANTINLSGAAALFSGESPVTARFPRAYLRAHRIDRGMLGA